MKPEFFAVMAVVLYAGMGITIDQYLKIYSPPAILLLCYAVMAPLALAALIFMKVPGSETSMPRGLALLIVFALGFVYFIADFSYVQALSGGRVVSVTLILVLVPVITGLLKYVLDREVPSVNQILAFTLAVGAVYFASRS